jgi:hypothetical protein
MPAGNLGISRQERGPLTIITLRGDDISIFGTLVCPTSAVEKVLDALVQVMGNKSSIQRVNGFGLG